MVSYDRTIFGRDLKSEGAKQIKILRKSVFLYFTAAQPSSILSFDIFTVEIVQNTIMEHDLYLIL